MRDTQINGIMRENKYIEKMNFPSLQKCQYDKIGERAIVGAFVFLLRKNWNNIETNAKMNASRKENKNDNWRKLSHAHPARVQVSPKSCAVEWSAPELTPTIHLRP